MPRETLFDFAHKNLNTHCIEYACKIAYIPSHKQKMICMCNKISTDPAKNLYFYYNLPKLLETF